MRRRALEQKKIWNPALFGIRNLLSWNPESSTRNPESTGWNPESRTVMDSLTWGDLSFLFTRNNCTSGNRNIFAVSLLKFVWKRLFSFTANWSDYILALTPNVSRQLSFVSVLFRTHIAIPTTKPIVNAQAEALQA